MNPVHIGMQTLKIACQWRLKESHLSVAEKNPTLQVFLSGHFDRDLVTVSLSPQEGSQPGAWNDLLVTGRVHVRACPVPANAALVFAGFCERTNGPSSGENDGVPCVVSAGNSHVLLSEIIGHNFVRNGPFVKELRQVMYTVGNLLKNVIELRVLSLDRDNGGITFSNSLIGGASSVEQDLATYIQDLMNKARSIKDAFPGTSNMYVPFNYSNTGFELIGDSSSSPSGPEGGGGGGQLALPALSYVVTETPKSNYHFWANCIERVAERNKLGDVAKTWDNMSLVDQAILAMDVIVYSVQYKPYIADTADKNDRSFEKTFNRNNIIPCEIFAETLPGSKTAASAGDCEDLAFSIMLNYVALSEFDVDHPMCQGKKFQSVLRGMRTVLLGYVMIMSLDCVHGAQLSDVDKNKVGGAHMNIQAFPVHYFRACVRRAEDAFQKGVHVSDSWPFDEAHMGYGLPVLVLEGTGMLRVRSGADARAIIRRYVYQAPSVAGAKKPLYHVKGEESKFFMAALEGFTNYFIRRGRPDIGGFWYLNEKGERGARFIDFEQESDKVMLLSHPRIPQSVCSFINEVMQLRPPQPDLILDEKHRREHVPSPPLDKLVQRVAGLGRVCAKNDFVSAYFSPMQTTPALCEQVWADVQKLDSVCKISYETEWITNEQQGYRVKFHV